MDWLEFTSSIVSSVAWPLGLVVILLFLRAPILALIPLLQKIKYSGFEMEFGRKVAEARQDFAVSSEGLQAGVPTPAEIRIIEIAKVSPRAAVTDAWRWVELAALKAAKLLLGNKFKNKTFTFSAIRELERHTLIEGDVVLKLQSLRQLRNDAVHSPEFAITSEAAVEYAQMAMELVDYLGSIKGVNKEGAANSEP